jgi:uncharacterized integral membrane protein
MIRKTIAALILVPVTIVLVLFAVANRHSVPVSFDPFEPTNPALAVTLPLFLLIMLLVIAGVVVGGVAAWLRQSKWRARARRLAAEVRKLGAENARLRTETGRTERRISALPAVESPRLSIPPD